MSDDGFIVFMKHIKKPATKRKDQKMTKRETEYALKIVKNLLKNRGSTEDFRHQLSLVMKTGNTEDKINVFRRRPSIVGLEYNSVPCIRLVKKSTSEIQSYFTAMGEPERTFSGFRCNLTRSVGIASYFLFGSNPIRDLRVHIWGDGCETTQIAFRIRTDKTSSVNHQMLHSAVPHTGVKIADLRWNRISDRLLIAVCRLGILRFMLDTCEYCESFFCCLCCYWYPMTAVLFMRLLYSFCLYFSLRVSVPIEFLSLKFVSLALCFRSCQFREDAAMPG